MFVRTRAWLPFHASLLNVGALGQVETITTNFTSTYTAAITSITSTATGSNFWNMLMVEAFCISPTGPFTCISPSDPASPWLRPVGTIFETTVTTLVHSEVIVTKSDSPPPPSSSSSPSSPSPPPAEPTSSIYPDLASTSTTSPDPTGSSRDSVETMLSMSVGLSSVVVIDTLTATAANPVLTVTSTKTPSPTSTSHTSQALMNSPAVALLLLAVVLGASTA